jgi:phytoene dehydrogenase-like protein
VVVVGGGLAGLVAARRCAAGGADVTLFESGDRVGGRVRTVERDGYRFDRGFQVLSTAYPAARRELDYGALDLRSFAAGTCVCRPGGRSALVDPLRHPSHAVETLLTPAVTAGDKLRLLRLRASLAGRAVEDAFDAPDDATIREFLVSRGFSDRFLSNVAEPFYGGVTLDRSLETSKRVFEATFAAFARGRTAVPATGMEAIPRHLSDRAREAGVRIETGAEVTRIRAGSDTAVVERGGESIATDAVVVATDPRSARDLTGVASIPTTGVGCTTAHYRLDGPPLSTGRLLLLNAHDAAPNVVAPLSAVAPAYAPEGETLLSATFLDDDRDDGRSRPRRATRWRRGFPSAT